MSNRIPRELQAFALAHPLGLAMQEPDLRYFRAMEGGVAVGLSLNR